MTLAQEEFLKVMEMYAGVADNGNLMAETGWNRRSLTAVGRGLVAAGEVTYKSVDAVGFEGGVYELVDKKD